MATNFGHMANYKEIYNKLLWIENQMVNGYMEVSGETEEEYVMRIESCRAVIGMARTALEMMIDELFRAGQITDAKVEEILQRISPNEQNHHSNLFGKIKLMEEYELVTAGTIKDMHFIRMSGNQELHATQAKDCYINEKENATKVYESLYRVSYLFAKQYMAEFAQMGREVEMTRNHPETPSQSYASLIPSGNSANTDIQNVYFQPSEKAQSKGKMITVKAVLIAVVALLVGFVFAAFLYDCIGQVPFTLLTILVFGIVWITISVVICNILTSLFCR
ncbi:MAG: DUF4145 domain-containing protein [Lachnospiraceae bacterium]|nr:DUF4145 domain-containing protein [Lachnospiraceae bacterium]